jgi:uncharacterized protein (TIGR02284 family)
MDRINHDAVKALSRLYEIVEAGEKGYAVAATNVRNRALKVLFRSYAQQRVHFKEGILAEIQRLGARSEPGESWLGAIHRGRITIFATMTIGEESREQVVLKEVVLGESYAIRTYENTLQKNLPEQTRELIQRQYDEVREIVDRVQMMRGKNGKRLMVRLYDTEEAAGQAIHKLKESGYSAESIEKMPLRPVELYRESGVKLFETILSGAVGGAVWGTVSAILASIGILQMQKFGVGMLTEYSQQVILAIVCIGLIIGGMFVGGGIGFFMGLGNRNEDDYLFQDSLEHGRVLIQVLTDDSRASRAWQLLAQANMEARARSPMTVNR